MQQQIPQTVDVSTARKNFSALIDQVFLYDRAVTITKRNIPVVEVVRKKRKRMMNKVFDKSEDEYGWLRKMAGSTKIKGKKKVSLSTNVDEIYYR